MAVVKNLMVRAGADFSGLTKATKKAQASMNGMQKSVSASCSKMSSAVGGLGKVFSRLGTLISVAAIVAAGKAAKEAYDAASEGETKLATVMRQRMAASDAEIQSIMDLTTAQQKLGVVEDDVQKSGAQQLATFLTQTDSLRTLIPAMNDLLAQQKGYTATAQDAVTVGNMMGKVMQGQTSALRRVGITFSAAEEAALKYGSEEQRAAMLAQIITNNVGHMNAALAATPSGRLQQVSNALGDIQESFGGAIAKIGTVFLPVLNTVASVLAAIATLANRVAQAIANVFGGGAAKGAKTVSYTAAAASGMDDLADATEGAGGAAKKAAKEAQQLLGFDKITKLADKDSSGSSGGGSSGSGVAGVAGGLISETFEGADEAGASIGWLETLLSRLKATADSLDFSHLSAAFDRLKKAAEPLGKQIFSRLLWFYDNVLDPLAHWTIEDALPAFLDVLGGALDVLCAVVDAFKPLGEWLWDNFLVPLAKWTGGVIVRRLELLAEALHGIADWVRQNSELFDGLKDTMQGVADFFGGVFSGDMDRAAQGIGEIFAGLVRTANGVLDGIESAASMFLGWLDEKTNGQFSEILTGIGQMVNGAVEGVRQVLDGLCQFVSGVFSGDLDKALAGIGQMFQGLMTAVKVPINGIIGFFEGLANGAIRGANSIINALNKISFNIPSWVPVIGGKRFGFNLRTLSTIQLPRLAEGAVLKGNDPFLAVVNDQKHGTNVETPLATMVDAFKTAIRSEGLAGKERGPRSLTIPVYIGGKKVTEYVIEDINDITRTTGVCPINI